MRSVRGFAILEKQHDINYREELINMTETGTGLFDDLVETADAVQQEQDSQPESKSEDNGKKRGPRKLPEVTRERIAVQDVNEVPAGYLPVKEFAFMLTKRNFETRVEAGETPTADDMVTEQAVYVATTAKRHTIPSAQLVLPSGTEVRGGIVVPLEAATAAWDARPERGEGAGGRGPLTTDQVDARVLRAGKAQSRLAKLEKQVKRYGELLEEVGKSWEDAHNAYAEWVSSQETEIADDEDTTE